jgi:hypothetical protein
MIMFRRVVHLTTLRYFAKLQKIYEVIKNHLSVESGLSAVHCFAKFSGVTVVSLDGADTFTKQGGSISLR